MKRDWIGRSMRPAEELVAGFGGARIVKDMGGKLGIRGGTEQEKAEAREWLRRFYSRGRLAVTRQD